VLADLPAVHRRDDKDVACAVDLASGKRKYRSMNLNTVARADLATMTNAIEQVTEPRP
jgi:hypothetical protein